jgi:hypothetical protein
MGGFTYSLIPIFCNFICVMIEILTISGYDIHQPVYKSQSHKVLFSGRQYHGDMYREEKAL